MKWASFKRSNAIRQPTASTCIEMRQEHNVKGWLYQDMHVHWSWGVNKRIKRIKWRNSKKQIIIYSWKQRTFTGWALLQCPQGGRCCSVLNIKILKASYYRGSVVWSDWVCVDWGVWRVCAADVMNRHSAADIRLISWVLIRTLIWRLPCLTPLR